MSIEQDNEIINKIEKICVKIPYKQRAPNAKTIDSRYSGLSKLIIDRTSFYP